MWREEGDGGMRGGARWKGEGRGDEVREVEGWEDKGREVEG